jgi:hypothetical protein
MITFTSSGSFKNTDRFLSKMRNLRIRQSLISHGREGVAALASATPTESGRAAASWDYKVSGGNGGWTITWTNSDVENGFPVAISLQYGYGTGTGGYVQGRDYINPAMRPVFDRIADQVWKEVTSA